MVPEAVDVRVSEDTLSVDLSDGRRISVLLGWYARLEHVSSKERANWRLIGKGEGIHWEDIDEDVSVEGLLAGKPSGQRVSAGRRMNADWQFLCAPLQSGWKMISRIEDPTAVCGGNVVVSG